jgi:molybdopterin-guanine dinucleotide biosynthesis protein
MLIGIGGGSSNTGKTTLACAILRELSGWGAIKCGSDALYTSVMDDPGILREPGTDTAAYLEAGASAAVLVKAPAHELPAALELAFESLGSPPGIVVEGNSAIEVLSPDIVIFSFDTFEGIKDSSKTVFEQADALVYGTALSEDAAEQRPAFKKEDIGPLLAYVKERLNERK